MPYRAQAQDLRDFARRLAVARQVHGYRQTELAALIDVSLPRYHAWEHGLATPNSIELYRRLCLQLGITMNWLFFGDAQGLSAKMKNLVAPHRAAGNGLSPTD